MKWKIDKKYVGIAGLALGIILVSLLFNNLLEEGGKYEGVGKVISGTMVPILGGFILAYLLNPVVKKLERYLFMPLAKKIYRKKDKERKQKKFSRTLGVVTTLFLFLLLVVGGMCVVIPQIYASVMKIAINFPAYYEEIEKWLMRFLEDNNDISERVLSMLDSGYEQLMNYINTVIIPNIDQIVKSITTGIIGGIKSVFNIVLAIIISIYVLFEKENLISYGKKITYSYLNRRQANSLIKGVRHVNIVFGGFVNGKIVDSLIIGVLCYIFMLVVGFEYAVLISIIIGITNIIPYFGPFIGAIPSVLLLLVTDPKQGLIFAIFVLVLQQVDGNIIGPLILGESLKLSSMWILIAILIGGGLFGVPGMILGAPTLACIYTILGKDTRRRLARKELPVESSEYLNLDMVTEDMKIKRFTEEEEKA